MQQKKQYISRCYGSEKKMNFTQENWRQRKIQLEYKISYLYLTASKLCNCFYQKEAYQKFKVVCHAATKLWMCCVGTDYALMPGQCRLDKVFVKSCLSFTLPSAVLLIPITLCRSKIWIGVKIWGTNSIILLTTEYLIIPQYEISAHGRVFSHNW